MGVGGLRGSVQGRAGQGHSSDGGRRGRENTHNTDTYAPILLCVCVRGHKGFCQEAVDKACLVLQSRESDMNQDRA